MCRCQTSIFIVFLEGYNCGLRNLSKNVTKSVINMTNYDNLRQNVEVVESKGEN